MIERLIILGLTIQKPDYLPGPNPDLQGEALRNSVLNTTFPSALNWTFGILGLATFIGFLLSAVNLLTSYGNEDKVSRAKTGVQYGVMGFALVLLSYAIVSIIVSVALPGTQP